MGIFITIEGGDGCGKTSVTTKAIELLKEEGFDITQVREPGGIEISEQIRDVILDAKNTNMDPITEAMLFAASRRQLIVQKLLPALEKNAIIVSDRYVDSSYVYQGIVKNVGIEKVEQINKLNTDALMPTLTILFDIDPQEAQKRIKINERSTNRFDKEQIEFHQKVREGYLQIAKRYPSRIKVVDASLPFEKVVENVYSIIKSEILLRR